MIRSLPGRSPGHKAWLCALLVLCVPALLIPAIPARGASGKGANYQLEHKAAGAWKESDDRSLWKIPLGGDIVEEMRFIAPGRMLVSLCRDEFDFPLSDLLMVDTVKGRELWRYPRAKLKGEQSFILTLSDIILIRADYGSKTALVAVSADDGKPLWTIKIKSDDVKILPVPGADAILVTSKRKGKLEITAFNALDGRKTWSRKVAAGVNAMSAPMLAGLDDFFLFENGTARISGRTGEAVWRNDNLLVDSSAPAPQRSGGVLFLVDAHRNLVRLDVSTGNSSNIAALPGDITITNIYPEGRHIFLRGIGRGSSTAGKFYTLAVDAGKGAISWQYAGDQPSVSNLIRRKRHLYFATPSNLVCLDISSGREVFSVSASRTGKNFPAGVVDMGDRIVFISEMIIAAFDPGSGKQLFRHGFTPVSNEAGIDGLGLYIARIQARRGTYTGSNLYGGLSNQFATQSRTYQNQANANWSRSRSFRLKAGWASGSSGEMASWDSWKASNQAQIDSAFSRASAMISFHFAMKQLEDTFNRAIVEVANKARLARLNFIRRSILSAYVAAKFGDYIFRPSLEDDVIGVSLVHIPTGKMRFVSLSPEKEVFGLWNMVDPDKGVIYHQGLRRTGGDPSGNLFGNYLLASRIDLR